MAKTPSPKVIASYMIREMFSNKGNFTTEDLSSLVDSRVSPEKRDKVMTQFDKVVDKFRQRIEKTINKFEAPPVPKEKVSKKKDKDKKSKK